MSAIDCIDHVHIGYFDERIAIYWPLFKDILSKVTDSESDEKTEISPYTLLLGGGSGEHPAMHFNNDAVVFHLFCKGFLFNNNKMPDEKEEIDQSEKKEVRLFLEKIIETTDRYFLNNKENIAYWNFDQNHWPVETFVEIYKSFKNIGLFDIEESDHQYLFNFVLKDLVGAIIANKMPLSAIENEDLKELVVLFRNNKEYLKKYMNEGYMEKLSSFFPDYAAKDLFGRNLKIAGNNINLGYCLEDWKRDHKDN